LNGNLLERRSKMLKLNAQAFPLSMVVNQLSAEYDVSKQAIYKDWKKRGSWQIQLLELGSLPQLCKDLYATHKEIYRMAVMEYLRGDNSAARVGALRLMRDLNLDFNEMFPRVIDVHIKGDKGDSITALLQEYADIYETEDAQKDVNIKLSWSDPRGTPSLDRLDITKFPEDQREKIREVARLLKAQRDVEDKREFERVREESKNRNKRWE
jgi:hypothetical protein